MGNISHVNAFISDAKFRPFLENELQIDETECKKL